MCNSNTKECDNTVYTFNNVPAFNKAYLPMMEISKELQASAVEAVVELHSLLTMQNHLHNENLNWMIGLGDELDKVVGPATILSLNNQFLIYNGNHRLTAKKKLGHTKAVVKLIQLETIYKAI